MPRSYGLDKGMARGGRVYMFIFTPGFYYVDSWQDEQLDGRVCGQFHGYIYSVELMIHV